ncbi:hypothetical protein XhyaCFBP1156_16140 [Xanthomonas hyacinthi]|uniref:Uncharacterized protein n=1 Tax=Xanthomonas hyacinthi TaxID=56455 RepID=A0A2S7ESL8_9XANT|nr:hypothetical protein XhyaCFBP1156_16140 [Xanthomonas hyacinthi]
MIYASHLRASKLFGVAQRGFLQGFEQAHGHRWIRAFDIPAGQAIDPLLRTQRVVKHGPLPLRLEMSGALKLGKPSPGFPYYKIATEACTPPRAIIDSRVNDSKDPGRAIGKNRFSQL